MTNKYVVIITIILPLYLAGCSQMHQQTMGENFGNAIKTNTAMQVIDPTAGQEDMPPTTLEGQKAEQAMKQYHEETGKADTDKLVKDVGQ